MLIDVADVNEYITINNLKEITTNNIFSGSSSQPDPEGIGSYEIFGNPGTKERKMTFAYIDLVDDFVHPLVLDTLIFLKRTIKDVIYGNGEFFIQNGKIIKSTDKTPAPDKSDAGNGVEWLKRNLKNIIFEKPNMSSIVKDRVSFIKHLKPNEIFINKWLVIPPYYRDIHVTKDNKKNDINIMYQSLIAQASLIKTTGGLFGRGIVTDTHRKIQDKIHEIYLYFMDFQTGTKTFMQQHVIGKAIDYASRMVISTPKIQAKNSREMEVDFSHSAVPLSMALECFAPFIVYGLKKFITSKIAGSSYIYYWQNNKFQRIELANHWSEVLLSENIKKLIKIYTDSKERRLDPFLIETSEGKKVPLGYITSDLKMTIGSQSEIGEMDKTIKPLTLCEIFYIVAIDTIKDKPILITRYPVEDYHNIYPSLMNIIPFANTKKVIMNQSVYPRFPIITQKDLINPDISSKFIDTLKVFPCYLSSLGGDFDGDVVSANGVFTNNSGSVEYIYSKTNIINIGGNTMRKFGDITSHTLFALTNKRVSA
jgi:DNA-directed RNA polymerase beta' subunit